MGSDTEPCFRWIVWLGYVMKLYAPNPFVTWEHNDVITMLRLFLSLIEYIPIINKVPMNLNLGLPCQTTTLLKNYFISYADSLNYFTNYFINCSYIWHIYPCWRAYGLFYLFYLICTVSWLSLLPCRHY